MADLNEVLTIEQIAEEARVRPKTARKFYQKMGLRHVQPGKRVLIVRRWWLEFLEKLATENATIEETGERADELIQRAKGKRK